MNGPRARVFRRQLAVDIILNDYDIVPLGQGQHLLLTRLRHDKPKRIIAVGHQDHRFDGPLLQCQLQCLNADPGLRIGRNFYRLDVKPAQHLHGAVERRRLDRHNVSWFTDRQQGDGERAVAAVCDHNLVRRHGGTPVEHQPGDLLAQFQTAVEYVIAQHFGGVVLCDAAHLTPQGLQARLVNVWRTAAKGDHLFVGAGIQQHHHLIPLGDVHRALHRTRHGRHRRLGLALRHKIAGARLGGDKLQVFEDLIGLLYGADAHAVLLAQRTYRRQTFTAAIQPLFNAFCQ